MSSLAAREPGLSAYTGGKRRGEVALSAMGPTLRWTTLRPAAVYGPGERSSPRSFRWIARGVAPLPSGAAGRFSLLYVDDLATAVLPLARGRHRRRTHTSSSSTTARPVAAIAIRSS